MKTYLIADFGSASGFVYDTKIVFILGAGASYSCGYPLMSEFASTRYLNWLHDQSVGVNPFIGLQEPRLRFLAKEQEILFARSRNVEEVLASSYASPEELMRVRKYIISVLSAAEDFSTHARTLHVSLDMLFLAFILYAMSEYGYCGVVTCNYDLAMETAASVIDFIATQNPVNPKPFNYLYEDVTSLVTGPNFTGSHLPNQYSPGGIALAKLHGSMNILACTKCESLHYCPYEMFADLAGGDHNAPTGNLKRWRCAKCGGDILPLVVPPGRRKQIPSALNRVWFEAERMLANAELVVLVGYSAPKYDVEARQLLVSALRKKHHLLLVDPYPADDTITFLQGLVVSSVTLLRQSSTTFFRNEMEQKMPDFIAKFENGCVTRLPNRTAMHGCER